ncbi:MAG: hypothetical protein WCG07_01585 [Candidatus Taylorbacteria bacterium]
MNPQIFRNITRPRNTIKEGVIENFGYQEGDKYIAVCLTFDIIEEASNPKEAAEKLMNAVQLHLETVLENNLSEDLLNRYAPQEYWDKYFEIKKSIDNSSKLAKSQKPFFSSASFYPQPRELVFC